MSNICELNNLIMETYEIKKELKRIKEKESKCVESLKKELESHGIDKQSFNEIGLKVSYTPSVKAIMNQDKLLNILKDLISKSDNPIITESIEGCIKIVEEVDESSVTDLVYSGIINVDDIKPAYEEKITRTLRIGEIK